MTTAALAPVRARDRFVGGRFVRNLTLSLSGGALLTVLGAAAAQAQEAGTDTAGSAGTGTGDATAVGNQSGTTTGQTMAPASGNGSPQVITQTAAVPNVGVAVANTGGNLAVGNTSTNTATAVQEATNGEVANANSGSAANGTDGSAWITTGDATAIGNESTTAIDQTALGQVSGLLVIDQDAIVLNAGVAVANTGLNGAIGNASTNTSTLGQLADNVTGPGGLATNAGAASSSSNGRASANTGDANALGNTASSGVAQTAGGAGDDASGGLVIIGQDAAVVNVGVGLANTGLNLAIGNVSDNPASAHQSATNDPMVEAPQAIASNTADVSSSSDGEATIDTGNASATGNDANTNLAQTSHAHASALGGIVSVQAALVANAGIGVANTGLNAAVGNAAGQLPASDNLTAVGSPQTPQTALNAGLGPGDVITDLATAANTATVSAATDGSAEIATGDATAVGNQSDTTLTQSADSSLTGSGFVVDPQLGVVLNAGAGIANTGANIAVGNLSTSVATVPVQDARVVAPAAPGVTAPVVTTTNTADVSTASDGTATIHTGDASATGNEATTDLSQSYEGDVDGAGVLVNAQVAAVANIGVGIANTGANAAIGNVSTSVATANQGADVTADELEAAGPLTVSNAATVAASSDGTASVRTGAAEAAGNRSDTVVAQDASARIGAGGMGVVPNVQVAGVANVGVGVANSGVNAAVGNASGSVFGPNLAFALQRASVDTNDPLEIEGPLTVTNTADVATASNGTGQVKTGDASATGNRSTTELAQHVDGTVEGMGLVVAPQIAGVANVGVGVANTGVNASAGNLSTSTALATGPGGAPQTAFFVPAPGVTTTVDGPLTVGSAAAASNASDGEACVCTGEATASGNISDTVLTQEMDIRVVDGVSVVPQEAGVLNAGFGLANSGVNLAVGNLSDSTAISEQAASLDPAAGPDFDGPQTISNNGAAANTSDGLGEVGTGSASATGNLSQTVLGQAATIDGAGVVGTMSSGTANLGVGIANSGINLGVGNASTNTATDVQTATGSGTVSNSGSATNDSDGTGQIGDPDCDDDKDEHQPPVTDEEPGGPTLPKTGSEVETQAALALMLLLAGFGLTTASRRRQTA